jgi:AcrR family transcriptional regulator
MDFVEDRTNQRRTAYHHGDLRKALTDAAAELARTGGPEAVVLREAARRAGVSAPAAYRHFANHADLVEVAKHHAQDVMTDVMRAAVETAERAAEPGADDPAALTLLRMRAAAHGYLDFARREPGLFRTAFCRIEGPGRDAPPAPPADLMSFSSYAMLNAMLDEMVNVGLMAAARRAGAETSVWAALHGLAVLLVDGPLRGLPEPGREAALEHLLAMVIDGLRGPADTA